MHFERKRLEVNHLCRAVVPKVGGIAPCGRWSRNGRLGGDRRPS